MDNFISHGSDMKECLIDIGVKWNIKTIESQRCLCRSFSLSTNDKNIMVTQSMHVYAPLGFIHLTEYHSKK